MVGARGFEAALEERIQQLEQMLSKACLENEF
jgi:hypothetical protein